MIPEPRRRFLPHVWNRLFGKPNRPLAERILGEDFLCEFPDGFARKLAKSKRPLLMTIGGCNELNRDVRMGAGFFYDMFAELVKNHEIELGSGGTPYGVPGFCGNAKETHGKKIFLFGSRTISGTRKEPADKRYDYVVTTKVCGLPSGWEAEAGGGAFERYAYGKLLKRVKSLNPKKKIVFIVYNGGKITLSEALFANADGHQVVLVQGSGGTADELADNETFTSHPNVHVVPLDPKTTAAKISELFNRRTKSA